MRRTLEMRSYGTFLRDLSARGTLWETCPSLRDIGEELCAVGLLVASFYFNFSSFRITPRFLGSDSESV